MSLYDDIDENNAKSVTGWSSGIKLLHSQLHVKKAMVPQPKKEPVRRTVPAAIPSTVLNAELTHKSETEPKKVFVHQTSTILTAMIPKQEKTSLMAELDWDLNLEYDPQYPNDYDKLIKERRERRGVEKDFEEVEKKRRPREEREKPRERTNTSGSGFAGRHLQDDEDEEPVIKKPSGGGVAIAPPPSLQETTQTSSPFPSGSPAPSGALGVAAKIMAKYGFKEGQGLGRQQQGIAAALQVEKTSKRGGRIINEKELMLPPPTVSSPPSSVTSKPEMSIAEMMKNPSKVVCLRNMVGPGEVDSELEPEVREECQSKYGDVTQVIIRELGNVADDEAVRIFVEFKRIEAAIKAVVDLNGRFFGGRQVKAGFYDVQKFLNMELTD